MYAGSKDQNYWPILFRGGVADLELGLSLAIMLYSDIFYDVFAYDELGNE